MSLVFDLMFIFFARIIDVSLGTVRMILTIRGERYLAAGIGFFEIMVYVVALGKVINSLHEPPRLIAYCLGFASGVLVGIVIEERLALGYRGLQVITDYNNDRLVEYLRDQGFGVTTWEGSGREGPKLVINIFVKRNLAQQVSEKIEEVDPNAFIVFMEPKYFRGGYIKK
ncbi:MULTISPECIES: DUF2179 domain-containing protein [Syntrophothermus]|uniref:UPF0316 protein Slip_0397 n=1 Tax=Syntrophothermus lipocalidus (strain DSM 12680 / TGB-C1) TaxID=643648 RepID=D7CKE6_SYNLT|nr:MULTISPECIES: DUF2179 domain-containing protein [Syntrophothermus]ADI01181.1 Protein of unknown function DUF2179 [Syntrophothermus lipocalidus DSM 12680]HOV43349.1 DUF2179 domain-containing protein [Syntrophothermus lipocalidus]